MGWATEGLKTNPSAGDILADTGPLAAGIASLTVIIWTDAGCNLNLVQRNALNTADVNSQSLQPNGSMFLAPIPIITLLNQRLQITVDTGVNGHVQASLLWA